MWRLGCRGPRWRGGHLPLTPTVSGSCPPRPSAETHFSQSFGAPLRRGPGCDSRTDLHCVFHKSPCFTPNARQRAHQRPPLADVEQGLSAWAGGLSVSDDSLHT